ncbi:hypothetical protein [Palleronia sp.]|uniref:hypothetical protein n=1 Tax=Palleronia sp. TaxID=1940284 RepID=UPI0035C85AB1
MKISRLAGLAALAVLAIGQARADSAAPGDGLGFGIIRDLTPVLRPAAMAPKQTDDRDTKGSLKIERIRIVRSDAMPVE